MVPWDMIELLMLWMLLLTYVLPASSFSVDVLFFPSGLGLVEWEPATCIVTPLLSPARVTTLTVLSSTFSVGLRAEMSSSSPSSLAGFSSSDNDIVETFLLVGFADVEADATSFVSFALGVEVENIIFLSMGLALDLGWWGSVGISKGALKFWVGVVSNSNSFAFGFEGVGVDGGESMVTEGAGECDDGRESETCWGLVFGGGRDWVEAIPGGRNGGRDFDFRFGGEWDSVEGPVIQGILKPHCWFFPVMDVGMVNIWWKNRMSFFVSFHRKYTQLVIFWLILESKDCSSCVYILNKEFIPWMHWRTFVRILVWLTHFSFPNFFLLISLETSSFVLCLNSEIYVLIKHMQTILILVCALRMPLTKEIPSIFLASQASIIINVLINWFHWVWSGIYGTKLKIIIHESVKLDKRMRKTWSNGVGNSTFKQLQSSFLRILL